MIREAKLSTLEAVKQMFADFMLQRRTAMPGLIRAVNLEGGKLVSVDVQPSIGLVSASEDGLSNEPLPLPIIPGVPVVFPYSQTLGLSLSIPIVVGDECLLVIADRGIDKWQENTGIQQPPDPVIPRSHDLTDAICIPGAIATPNGLTDYQQGAIEIRNKDRSTRVTVTDNSIDLVVGSTSMTIVDGTVTINATNFIVNSTTSTINATTINLEATTTNVNDLNIDGVAVDQNGVTIEDHIHVDSVGVDTSPPQN